MVSLNTILAIGGIGAAYILFQSLGGASGIGSRIGGGFATFGSSLTSALNPLSSLSNPFTQRTGFTEDGQFYDTSALTGMSTTPQQRQDSLNKQNDPNLSHDRWEDVITEVCDKYGNCKPYDGSGIINETPQSERDTSFNFLPSAYGDTYNNNRITQPYQGQEAALLDPNLAADRFVDPAGKYDPFSVTPIADPFDQGMKEETRTPTLSYIATNNRGLNSSRSTRYG